MRGLSLIALSSASYVAAQRASLQTCTPGWVPGSFSVNPDSTVTQEGMCLGFDATSILLASCSGNKDQQWTFHPDGTVESVSDPGQCWNAYGGATGSGTPIVMYQCGSRAARNAANDIFWPLSASKQILGNESGLCMATATPPFVCTGDACCSLNGAYSTVSATCSCFAPWGGTNCTTLKVLPPPPIQGYGMAPNLTSWGGNIAFYGGEYHMYVAEMENHCPLSNWGSNSACVHATSSTIEGPFLRQDVAVGVWCHNPQVMVQPNGTATVFALFHIGDGSGGNPKNCNTSTMDEKLYSDGQPTSNAAGSTLHVATDPAGPWTPVVPSPPSCNNPAPLLHPNGTWFMVCNGFSLITSPSLYGPWSTVKQISASTGTPVAGTYEDPYLYIDPRGNWHLLYHVYTTDVPNTCVNSTVSGHYFSPDGLTWTASNTPPYGNQVSFTDGSSMVLATRERPKMFFNAAGDPTHLMNGVCGGSSFCAPTPCVNCKYNSWDFTLVQPLDMS